MTRINILQILLGNGGLADIQGSAIALLESGGYLLLYRQRLPQGDPTCGDTLPSV